MDDAGLRELAARAHMGTSFVPERRAQQRLDEYREHLEGVRAGLEELAKTDARRAVLEEMWPDYVAGFRSRYGAYLGAMGRTLSPMITGGSNFPTRRNQKALDTEHRRYTDLIGWDRRARKRLKRAIVRADAPDPRDELRLKIQNAERYQEAAKAANRIVRRKKLTDDEKVAAIVELGLKEATARKLLEPDFAGRLGVPGYELTSIRGKIKRWKARLAELERAEAAPAEGTPFDGGVIEECPADDRLRIRFDEKPDEETRATLKRSGFRWSRRAGAWQRQLTAAARLAAREILPGRGS